ncbi:hypothetical protein [Paenimyroides baculatum]|uniref:Uncharacterized protein n=1 Tax=Paenimyroides baculatum TaxID=2608000 RepID=A0A5M6CGL4_9FLAO|nr:hypothetical protein [Paenimyroides baculatum]KAA5534311.1 hypothetical protein F0460_09390 [Paenimyroides baculatum]
MKEIKELELKVLVNAVQLVYQDISIIVGEKNEPICYVSDGGDIIVGNGKCLNECNCTIYEILEEVQYSNYSKYLLNVIVPDLIKAYESIMSECDDLVELYDDINLDGVEETLGAYYTLLAFDNKIIKNVA